MPKGIYKRTEYHIKRLKDRNSKGENHYNWKGDKVGYSGLHYWVNRCLGKPEKCYNCKTITAKRYEWANKGHKYKRTLDNWLRLCSTCHKRYDGISDETRKKMSDAKKGKHILDETRRKISEGHKGMHHTEQTKKKI